MNKLNQILKNINEADDFTYGKLLTSLAWSASGAIVYKAKMQTQGKPTESMSEDIAVFSSVYPAICAMVTDKYDPRPNFKQMLIGDIDIDDQLNKHAIARIKELGGDVSELATGLNQDQQKAVKDILSTVIQGAEGESLWNIDIPQSYEQKIIRKTVDLLMNETSPQQEMKDNINAVKFRSYAKNARLRADKFKQMEGDVAKKAYLSACTEVDALSNTAQKLQTKKLLLDGELLELMPLMIIEDSQEQIDMQVGRPYINPIQAF